MNIGFIGLGIMGSRMAANLQKNGHTLTVYNRTREKADSLIAGGARWAGSPAALALASQAEIIFTMLAHPEAVDEAARKVLRKSNLAQYFTHSTGHGLGLEIHEAPRLAAGQTQVLEPGMVITIEPGAYIPGKQGVRIEDVVVVTSSRCEVLTPTDKELIVV